MQKPIPTALVVLFLASMALTSSDTFATSHGKGPGAFGPAMHQMHHKTHGRYGDHRGRHGGRLLGPHWKESLTAEQRTRIDQMHVAFAKEKLPLKLKAKTIKVELALLATADKADNKAIAQRVDELLALKKQIMQKRYAHIAAMRALLTAEQRASFDLEVLRKAKKGRGRHH